MTQVRRLLVLTPTFPYPPASGGDLRAFHLLRRLAHSYDVHLLAPAGDESHRLREETGITAVHAVASGPRQLGWMAQRLNLWRDAPHGISFDIDHRVERALTQLLSSTRFDALLIDHLYMLQYARYATNVPVFYSATDVETVKFARWYEGESASWRRRGLRWLQRRTVMRIESRVHRQARVTFATSESDRSFLERLNGAGRFLVAANGVDLDYFIPRTPASFEGPPAILFVGTMYYKPNYDAARTLVEDIFPIVRQQMPDATCHIVGKTGDQDFHGLHHPERGIHMHGFVPDIRPYLNQVQLLIVPLSAGSGTRIKILDAMASGTPVVSTTIGAEGIDYEDGRHLLIANGPQSMADAAVAFANDRSRAAAIGAAGRELAQRRYSWDTSAAVILRELDRELSGK